MKPTQSEPNKDILDEILRFEVVSTSRYGVDEIDRRLADKESKIKYQKAQILKHYTANEAIKKAVPEKKYTPLDIGNQHPNKRAELMEFIIGFNQAVDLFTKALKELGVE